MHFLLCLPPSRMCSLLLRRSPLTSSQQTTRRRRRCALSSRFFENRVGFKYYYSRCCCFPCCRCCCALAAAAASWLVVGGSYLEDLPTPSYFFYPFSSIAVSDGSLCQMTRCETKLDSPPPSFYAASATFPLRMVSAIPPRTSNNEA